ncbi:MAG: (E)-4-hydroxy-3-methylbut-2-enyl-diphosphate synthase [Bacteroidales bacterium]|nr:(E)-4-hydroxy-3-methylbut-2-enyl-diphosphate synthase [Bacteroidales bacterium]
MKDIYLKNYCASLNRYSRLKTREVFIGKIPLGNNHPIRIQSMTNTQTSDIESTVEQCIRIVRAGADFVRITVPSVKDTDHLRQIKDNLTKKGHHFPLVADIHFNPQVAEKAAAIVEKIRINPGNYADRNLRVKSEFTETDHQLALKRIRDLFVPLIRTCKKHHTAIRIGVNHGSLSERIVSRYGDTPLGMAESAMEFLRICIAESFYDIVLSMKASNTLIMVQATRLLVHLMMKENMIFPLHLGVTEAGEGEDGRIKSAVGIGSLLAEGIGDTIRISLTEEPECEIPVANKMINHLAEKINQKPVNPFAAIPVNPFEYNRRQTSPVQKIGGSNPPVVVSEFLQQSVSAKDLIQIGWIFNEKENKWTFTDQSADLLYLKKYNPDIKMPEEKAVLIDYPLWSSLKNLPRQVRPLMTSAEYLNKAEEVETPHFIMLSYRDLNPTLISRLKNDPPLILVLEYDKETGFHGQRAFVFELMNNQCDVPVIFRLATHDPEYESFQLKSAADLGGLFIDGLGDGIWLSNNQASARKICSTAFAILQASRARISRVEYISCPSCGRTNFNIMEVSAKIRERTSHLKGLKIGIMGCIVNGIGEMADADYGYVGSGKGKVNLYKAREMIRNNIPEAEAVDELIRLIKKNGDWVNP